MKLFRTIGLIKTWLLVFLFSLLMLSSCNLNRVQDNLQANILKPDSMIENPSDQAYKEPPSHGNTFEPGENIPVVSNPDPGNPDAPPTFDLEYVIENIRAYKNVRGSDIDLKEIAPNWQKDIKEDGTPHLGRIFLLADVVVRNIKSEGILHDGKTLWISDVGIVDVSALSDPSAQTASEIIYFSHHPETSDPEELSEIYYHFQLEQGKELRCQVGFLIDREVFEKGSYELTIGRGMATMIEGGTKYVKFEASLEDSR